MLEIVSSLSGAVTAIGVAVAAYQLRVGKKLAVTVFEDSLTAQYRFLTSSIPLAALLGETLTTKLYEAHLHDFHRYFDLCNEQAFLHKTGRISDRTWVFWKDGIVTNLHRPAFLKAWQDIASRATDDFDELRHFCPPEVLSR